MKSNFQKIAVLCTCTGLLCSCGQSDNKQEHHKEFIPITIL
ncbi:efflux transporter periplasmic adaptor subunit, partial [Phocaeicola vulgatus]